MEVMCRFFRPWDDSVVMRMVEHLPRYALRARAYCVWTQSPLALSRVGAECLCLPMESNLADKTDFSQQPVDTKFYLKARMLIRFNGLLFYYGVFFFKNPLCTETIPVPMKGLFVSVALTHLVTTESLVGPS